MANEQEPTPRAAGGESHQLLEQQTKEFTARAKGALEARVQRLVPGSLVYVETASDDHPFVFGLSNVVIRQIDGSYSRYCGEPFGQLGLAVGSSVLVVDAPGPDATLIIDPARASQTGGLLSRARIRNLFKTR